MIIKGSERYIETRENMRGGFGPVTLNHYCDVSMMTAPVRLCAELVLSPGSSVGLHKHEREDEIYLVLSGRGVVIEDGVSHHVLAGDTVLTGDGASHSVSNDGDSELRIAAMIVTYP